MPLLVVPPALLLLPLPLPLPLLVAPTTLPLLPRPLCSMALAVTVPALKAAKWPSPLPPDVAPEVCARSRFPRSKLLLPLLLPVRPAGPRLSLSRSGSSRPNTPAAGPAVRPRSPRLVAGRRSFLSFPSFPVSAKLSGHGWDACAGLGPDLILLAPPVNLDEEEEEEE